MAGFLYKPIKRYADKIQGASSTEFPAAYTTISTPRSSTAVASTLPVPTSMPILPLPTTKKRGSVLSDNIDLGNMQWFKDLLEEEGINGRITSGLRPGAMTSSGHTSYHSTGDALDLVAADGEDLDGLYSSIIKNSRIVKALQDRGYGILRETTDKALARTGGSGYHYHIGKDHSAVEDLSRGLQGIGPLYAKKGTKLDYQQVEREEETVPNYVTYFKPTFNLSEPPTPTTPEQPPIFTETTKQEELPVPKESTKYVPTIDDLVDFTAGFETFQANPYELKEESSDRKQLLAGYGSADPYVINLAKNGQLTEEIARRELKRHLQSTYNELDSRIENFKNLAPEIQLALTDTAYNIGTNKLIDKSPSLMGMINDGVTDPEQLVVQMDHSKSAGKWLGVRSAARRAMALGKYDWGWGTRDIYGRQVDYNQYKGEEDWKSSPYVGYKNGGKFMW